MMDLYSLGRPGAHSWGLNVQMVKLCFQMCRVLLTQCVKIEFECLSLATGSPFLHGLSLSLFSSVIWLQTVGLSTSPCDLQGKNCALLPVVSQCPSWSLAEQRVSKYDFAKESGRKWPNYIRTHTHTHTVLLPPSMDTGQAFFSSSSLSFLICKIKEFN